MPGFAKVRFHSHSAAKAKTVDSEAFYDDRGTGRPSSSGSSSKMAHFDVLTLGLLLFIACIVAIITRKIGLSYSVGLVAAGIMLSLSGYRAGIALTPELIFTILLPPLVFEAALHLRWDQFR